jgi:surface antigen
MKKTIVMLGFAALLASSCTKEQFGTSFGAVGGGVVGSMLGKGSGQVVGTLLGAAGGAYLGHTFGAAMDKKDQQYNTDTTVRTLETARAGHTNVWRNPDTGHSGTVVINKTYQGNTGEYCREFTQKVNIGGKTESGYGTACRQPDGAWKIVQ